MKYIYILFSLPLLLLPLSCSADTNANSSESVIKLLNDFFPKRIKKENPNFILGDFNGDGIKDIAVLFTPRTKPIETAFLKVSTPWIYPSTKKSKKYHTSLVIFQNTDGKWLNKNTHAFVMLDNTGVLETPSFRLIANYKNSKDYNEHVNMLPVKINNDLIILPTEAGIDTYVYWDKNTYKLFEPEETP